MSAVHPQGASIAIVMDSTDDSERSRASTDNDVQSISRSSQEQLPGRAEALPGSEDAIGMERHRDMMLASLLEDYYRNRALEFLNTASSDRHYTRQSPEVEALASQLFGQAGQVLSSNGLLTSRVTSDDAWNTRRQYLFGLEALVTGSQAPNALDSTMRDIVAQTSQLNLSAHPANDTQLSLRRPPEAPHSHYKASFREDRLLGRGGFGKVYQCYNFLDQKTYAVKKIALPPKLVKSFSDGKHDDLQHVLREVKAMAMLDHPNIVRYHATWFEKPQQSSELLGRPESILEQISRHPRPLLLDSQAATQMSDDQSLPTSGGIVFEEDTLPHTGAIVADGDGPNPIDRGWSEDASLGLDAIDSSSASESNLFVGGETTSDGASPNQIASDTNVHALYIQMSMYPMTLAQFISPASSSKSGPHHCFHLAPTLRLALCILEGLRYIHSKGYIHRDIKPGNIFLSSLDTPESGCFDASCRPCAESNEGQPLSPRWLNPRIGDFGLVHQLAQGEVSPSPQSPEGLRNEAGTRYYQPPQQGEKKGEKMDIFALGVVLVEMLCRCGTAMERVDMLRGLQAGVLPLELHRNILDEGHDSETADKVVALLSSMIEGESEKRWSGARVHEALQDLLGRCRD